MPGEVPPGDAVGDEGDRRLGPEERGDGAGDAGQGRHLGADDDGILRAELGRVGGGLRAAFDGIVGQADGEAPLADGGQLRTAGDDRDLGPALGEPPGEVPADGAGPVDADPHAASSSGV
jgi:hypothetical protein